MFVANVIVAVVLAAILVVSGRGKLVRDARVTSVLDTVGVAPKQYLPLAICEFAGAAGLLVGIAVAGVGAAAAVGIILYFLGAVGAHLRVRDHKGLPTPAVLLLLAVAAFALRLASA